MQVTQLNHTAIPVADLDRSIRFYEDVLGLKQIPRPDFGFPGAWFRLGVDQELHMIARENTWDEPLWDRHFALMIDDSPAFAAHLTAKGVEFRGPSNRPDGATQIFFRDPDGHVVELCTPATS